MCSSATSSSRSSVPSAAAPCWPAKSVLFGAYGIGLFIGFFGYFIVLVVLVTISGNFGVDFFLDGRRKAPRRG